MRKWQEAIWKESNRREFVSIVQFMKWMDAMFALKIYNCSERA